MAENQWTVETLKQHYDRILEEKERALSAALAAAEKTTAAALISAEKAVTKAEESQLRVNIGQNEFRGALKDQAATLLPRAEAEIRFKALEEKIGTAAVSGSKAEGHHAGINSVWLVGGMVLLAITSIVGIVIAVVK